MTSVLGHPIEWNFTTDYQKWHCCHPGEQFDAPTEQLMNVRFFRVPVVEIDKLMLCEGDQERNDVAAIIRTHVRGAFALFIWADYDREGESIGTEVRDIALKVNSQV